MRYHVLSAVSLCLLFTATLNAANRYSLLPAALAQGGIGERIELRLENDVAVRAYAFGIRVDPAQLRLTGVIATGTFSEGAEYLAGRLDGDAGVVGYGCVFAFSPLPEDILQPGVNHLLLQLAVDVIGAADTSAAVAFEPVPIDDNPIRPPVINMLTNLGGLTVLPELTPGEIQIQDRTPRLLALSGNSGHAGKIFRVEATFLSEPDLSVQVCDTPASFTIEPGGAALLVTAPSCASAGWAILEICTLRGCDERAEGFEYLPPLETEFVRGNVNNDAAVDLSDGVSVLRYLFQGGPAAACHDAMDINDDGTVDLSDAPYLFNFLFLGGPEVPPPYPQAGTDPTADGLPGC